MAACPGCCAARRFLTSAREERGEVKKAYCLAVPYGIIMRMRFGNPVPD
jgi:hypothetical protein